MYTQLKTRLGFFLLTAFVLGHSNFVLAQSYPSKPIRIIAVNAVGSGVDAIVRNLTAVLSKSIGQPVVVENIAGAGGLTGSQTLVRAPADGYTLGVVSSNTPSFLICMKILALIHSKTLRRLHCCRASPWCW
jgi:tripartite-type tricarboxylate transporter receptor subunit TctC